MANLLMDPLKLFFDTKSGRTSAAAVILATVVTAVIVLIRAGTYDTANGLAFNNLDPSTKWYVVLIYLVLLAGAWFILHLQFSREFSDVYSEVREAVTGRWIVTYEAHVGPFSSVVVAPTRNVQCDIYVNELKKLEMKFTMINNPMFKDDTQGTIVRDVAVRANEIGGYSIFYYYTADRSLHSTLAEIVRPEAPDAKSEEIEIETFGHIQFAKPSRRKHRVEAMQGHWYDLNGKTSRLLALLDARERDRINGKVFRPMKLSEAPIHQNCFDADMGGVSFVRAD